MEVMGIDVSKWQGIIDFNRIDKNKVKFAIIKMGGNNLGEYMDSRYRRNYTGFEKIAIPTGAYYYLGSDFTVPDTVRHMLTLLSDTKFAYPIYLDVEETRPAEKMGVTEKLLKIGDALEACGYFVGIYGSDIATFRDRVDLDKLRRFSLWVARYGANPSYVNHYSMWQSNNDAHVSGITGEVDINYAYEDFPRIIKGGHYNGY